MFHLTCFGFSLQLLTSTFAHAFTSADKQLHRLCWKIDFVGIAGSSFVAVFLLQRDLQYSNQAIILSTVVFSFMLYLLIIRSKQMQYIVLPGLFAWVAVLATCKPIMIHHPLPFWIGLSATMLGGFFYISHFPECIKPGAFNIIGASHSWWHIATSIQMGSTYYICWVLSIDKIKRPDVFLLYLKNS